jgi:hypothetical protein
VETPEEEQTVTVEDVATEAEPTPEAEHQAVPAAPAEAPAGE